MKEKGKGKFKQMRGIYSGKKKKRGKLLFCG